MPDNPTNADKSPPPSPGPLRGEVAIPLTEALEMAQSLQRDGFLGEAESVYRQILARKPNQPEALHFLGVVLSQTGRRDEGVELILAALELKPDYVDAFSNLGHVLQDLGHLEEAEEAYRHAIKLNPDFADAHLNLSSLLFECDKFEESLKHSQRAMEIAPMQSKAHVIAGEAFAKEGRHAEAAEAYMRAMERNLFHAGVHERMGISLLRMGRTAEAIDIYQRWISLDPENPRPHHHLAACTGIGVPVRASNQYILEVFDRFAGTFDERLTALKYSAPTLVVESVGTEMGEPQGQYEILDAGCGTGLCGAGIRPFAKRLTGVDLSSKMLAKAQERNLYDELIESELTEYLLRSPQGFDVIISADTLVYFGDLRSVMMAAAAALRPEGRFVFTLEKAEPADAPDGFRLESHGRYAHTMEYVRNVIEQAGLKPGEITEVFLRTERREAVKGWLAVGRRN